MMFMRADGTSASAPAIPLDITPEAARRWQDAAAAKFQGQGLTAREIGLLLNLDKSTVCRRLKAMPAEARAHFGGG